MSITYAHVNNIGADDGDGAVTLFERDRRGEFPTLKGIEEPTSAEEEIE